MNKGFLDSAPVARLALQRHRHALPSLAALHRAKTGFSLVELSIVLVILGLLVGGILTGQSLIRAAELRSVTTEYSQYQTAVMTFRDKYFVLPGDMHNATDFWGGVSTGTCPTGIGAGTETCNGDGNGQIDSGSTGEFAEDFMFWQHLANAGLIEGSYTGKRGGTGSTHSVLGENIPQSKISNAGWVSNYIGVISGDANAFDGNYGNRFNYGTIRANGGAWDRVLTPEEAWNIDRKIDDGLPARGNILAGYWNDLCSNGTASDDFDAAYKLQDKSIQCNLYFVRAF